ncbi:MAG: hypothetical protein IPM89_14555 [Candidatus Competibacteraceae bacterium]|nr:MAG: hypothetical protein IPM89_14555 [Candidatus Competibacteraceae bacterium]
MQAFRINPDAPSWAKRASQIMSRRGVTKKDLPKVFDRALVTTEHYLGGRLKPSPEQMFRLAAFLNTTVENLLGDAELTFPKEDPSIPIRDMLSLRAMNDPIVDEELLGREPTAEELTALVAQVNGPSDPEDAERIVPPGAVSEYAFGVRVLGRAAEPEFRDGEVLIIDPLRNDLKTGDFVLYQQSTEALPTIRMLVIRAGKRFLYPVPDSVAHPPMEVPKNAWFLEKILAKAKIYAKPECDNDDAPR